MSNTELLIKEVQSLPENCVKEALELIAALKEKHREKPAPSSRPDLGEHLAADSPCTLDDLGEYLAANSPKTIEEALRMAEAKANDPNRKPISRFFGTLPGAFGGDGVAYQRKIRDEWD
jgi:hypothetical protein